MKKTNLERMDRSEDNDSVAERSGGEKQTVKSDDFNFAVNDSNLLNYLLDHVLDFIYFKDTQNRFIRASRSLAQSFGIEDTDELIGKTDFDFFTNEHAQQAFEGENEILRTGRTLVIEEKETRKDHADNWVLTTKMPMYDQNGKIIGTFGISRDITDRKNAEDNLRHQAEQLKIQIHEINQLQEQLQDQAIHDALTGLCNRRVMDQVLSKQLSVCKQLRMPFCIIIIDIDQFKSINDKYGHQVGDAFLEEYGKCIMASTRSNDFSCRLGGDEILMAFQNMTLEEANHKAESIRQKLRAIEITHEDEIIHTTVSIGIASFPADGKSINELITRADEAMYSAKSEGRDQIILASKLELDRAENKP
jgi:diguanylate cyclase (GGDEF)-like protein/PAS domain S-box-containing protein